MAEKGQYVYDYPRPMVTVDAVVFAVEQGGFEVLLIKRKYPPFEGMWALPGGFVEMDEPLEAAAARELEEETGVQGVRLEQFGVFGNLGRDPRGRSITVGYLGFMERRGHSVTAGDDAAEATWLSAADLPQLSFDHNLVVARAIQYIRILVHQENPLKSLLPAGISVEAVRGTVAFPRDL